MRSLSTLLLLPLACWAQTSDPLQAPACRQALQDLQSVEAASGAGGASTSPAADSASQPPSSQRPRPIPAALQAARRQAAHACLGTRLDAPLPEGRWSRPPVTVAPAAGATAIPWPTRTGPAAPQPTPRVPVAPLNSITSCDATGCWSSDGTRLQRQGGGQLLGPRGYCTVTGAVVTCP